MYRLRSGITDFKMQRRGNNENVKKAIGFISKTTTLQVHHACLYISCPFLHDYDVKMPNFANSTPGGFTYIWQSKWVGIVAIKTEGTPVHFLSDVLVAFASSSSRLFQFAENNKCRRISLELISWGPHSSLEREKEIRRCLFTSSIKLAIRHFHVVVVQGR